LRGAGSPPLCTTSADVAPQAGYIPGFLDAVTDWVLRRTAGGKSSGAGLKGTAQEPVLPYAVAHYERLAWYGNSLVQLPLALGFCLLFAAGCLIWPGLAVPPSSPGGKPRTTSDRQRTGAGSLRTKSFMSSKRP
jgi:hypothetical protein